MYTCNVNYITYKLGLPVHQLCTSVYNSTLFFHVIKTKLHNLYMAPLLMGLAANLMDLEPDDSSIFDTN